MIFEMTSSGVRPIWSDNRSSIQGTKGLKMHTPNWSPCLTKQKFYGEHCFRLWQDQRVTNSPNCCLTSGLLRSNLFNDSIMRLSHSGLPPILFLKVEKPEIGFDILNHFKGEIFLATVQKLKIVIFLHCWWLTIFLFILRCKHDHHIKCTYSMSWSCWWYWGFFSIPIV